MSENIAGYIDRKYVKGQYYKTAGCPKPIIYTGNIDTISDDLLVKAMFVRNTPGSGASGTFPEFGVDTYLLTTVEYGSGDNTTYLQSAVSATTGFEYKRVYSNGDWLILDTDKNSPWLAVDSKINSLNTRVTNLDALVNTNKTNIELNAGNISNLGTRITEVSSTSEANKQEITRFENEVNSSIQSIKGISSVLGPKITIVKSKIPSTGITTTKRSQDVWYWSNDVTVNITGLGFATVSNVFIGSSMPDGKMIFPMITGISNEKIMYRFAAYTHVTVKDREDSFLIIGTAANQEQSVATSVTASLPDQTISEPALGT